MAPGPALDQANYLVRVGLTPNTGATGRDLQCSALPRTSRF